MTPAHPTPDSSLPAFLVPEPVLRRHRRLAGTGGRIRPAALARLCSLYRIDTLAALWSAQHGWLGASFSALELLATTYHAWIPTPAQPVAQRSVFVLSKGHAAAAHYAILAALGAFPRERLLDYKASGGLPAHSDRSVPGVDADSGSLGMGLSKALGIARAHRALGTPARRAVALLGDGELQEGQVFESLLSLRQQDLRGCVALVDRNGLQTDSRTDQIKDAADWRKLLSGIGLHVLTVDGHDPSALLDALAQAGQDAAPTVVLAHTVKGEGTSLTRMPAQATARREGVWHGRVPSAEQYVAVLRELVASADDPELAEALERHLHPQGRSVARSGSSGDREPAVASRTPPTEPGAAPSVAALSTADAFGTALLAMGQRYPSLHVLDADLEAPCRLSPFARRYPQRFVEIGISEQDMISQAAGLALGGCVAVANTYAAFLKRAIDQLAACAAEGLPVIAVGHYAGLDYFTDGKSHQALEDVGLLRAVGGVEVYEPLTADEVAPLLEHLVARMHGELRAGLRSRAAYLRLHRTPALRAVELPAAFAPGRPYVFPAAATGALSPHRVVVSDPHLLASALEVQSLLVGACCPWDVIAVSSYFEGDGALVEQLRGAAQVVALESHLPAGGLRDLLSSVSPVPVRHVGPTHRTGSVRTLTQALAAHGLDVAGLRRELGGLGK